MLALRNLSRSLPRAVAKTPRTALRVPSISLYKPSSSFSPSIIASSRPAFAAAFSTSGARYEDSPEIDQEIAVKLSEEVAMEKGPKPVASMPKELESYLGNSPFKLVDTPGSKVIVLKRDFGYEKITVAFSTDDVNDMNDPQNEDDPALFDDESPETLQAEDTSASQAGSAEPIAQSPDGEEPADEEEDELQPTITIDMEVVVKKKGKGSIRIDAVAEDGNISISGFEYFTPEGEKQAETPIPMNNDGAGVPYAGPQFQSLDEELQLMFERYLETRGVDIKLALFAPVYVEWKEQQEYLRWLENVKGFIEA